MTPWFARPVLSVADIDRTVAFYVEKLGFTESWRHLHEGKPLVAQVERDGCLLIFDCQWPENTGRGVMFIAMHEDKARDLRAEYMAKGIALRDGWWGYPLMIVDDPDGNQLFFQYPDS